MENELKIQIEKLVNEKNLLREENIELKNKVSILEGIIDELFDRVRKMERLKERYKAL